MTVPISDTNTLETGLRVRRATGQDLPAMVETLTAAFSDDPVMTWWVPNPDDAPRSFVERRCGSRSSSWSRA